MHFDNNKLMLQMNNKVTLSLSEISHGKVVLRSKCI